MNQRHEDLANQVVSGFRANLESGEQEIIGDARFQGLHRLICEALAQELQTAASRVEGLVRELRAEIDKPELGL